MASISPAARLRDLAQNNGFTVLLEGQAGLREVNGRLIERLQALRDRQTLR